MHKSLLLRESEREIMNHSIFYFIICCSVKNQSEKFLFDPSLGEGGNISDFYYQFVWNNNENLDIKQQ